MKRLMQPLIATTALFLVFIAYGRTRVNHTEGVIQTRTVFNERGIISGSKYINIGSLNFLCKPNYPSPRHSCFGDEVLTDINGRPAIARWKNVAIIPGFVNESLIDIKMLDSSDYYVVDESIREKPMNPIAILVVFVISLVGWLQMKTPDDEA